MKEKINITIDEDIIRELRKMAKDDNRTLSNYIDSILKEYVNQIKMGAE